MYLIIHYFILKTLVIFNVNNIGFTGFPMPIEDLFHKMRFIPVFKRYKRVQLYVLSNLELVQVLDHEYGEDNTQKTHMIFLTREGWNYYHSKTSSILKILFQCFWNVAILIFGYYLGSLGN